MYFLFINKTLRLNNLKTRTAMNAKISVFVICVEAIIYLLLYNLHDCTFSSIMNAESSTTLYENYFLLNCFWYLHKWFRLYEWDTEVSHSSFHPPCEGGKLDLWTQRNPGGTEIFQYQSGKKKRGKEELLKFSLWGKLLKMKFQTENKISEWI